MIFHVFVKRSFLPTHNCASERVVVPKSDTKSNIFKRSVCPHKIARFSSADSGRPKTPPRTRCAVAAHRAPRTAHRFGAQIQKNIQKNGTKLSTAHSFVELFSNPVSPRVTAFCRLSGRFEWDKSVCSRAREKRKRRALRTAEFSYKIFRRHC